MEVVHHDAPDARVQRLAQFLGALVVAVEVDALGGHAAREGHGELAAGHHVEPQPFLGEDARQRPVQERLPGVEDLDLGVPGAKLGRERAALAAKRRFVEYVERRAVLRGQIERV